jgi:hypothetical protein
MESRNSWIAKISSNLSFQDKDKLLATRDIGDYWTEKPPKRHIHVLVEPPETTATLSQEIVSFACIINRKRFY